MLKSLCLVMIVKNEAAVIRRCLDSVKGLISHWVICDTGSTDGTQQVIAESLRGIPGTLQQVPWVDFGHNRTQALKFAKGKADYHLLIDADMTVSVRAEFRDKLSEDSYWIRFEGPIDYYVERLVSDRHDWRFVGATHEFVCSDTARTREKRPELSVTHFEDGGARADKYQRDIQLLKRELETEPNNPRNVFYLAQSYRDTGNLPQAVEWYERRASLGGWDEEVWCSLYQVARLQHRLGLAWPLVLDAYLRAYQFRPTRVEPLFCIARYYLETEQYHVGWLFARTALETPYPDDILFVERNIYEYELPMEYAICSGQLGRYEEAIRVSDAIIACPTAPENVRETVRKNKQFCLDAARPTRPVKP